MNLDGEEVVGDETSAGDGDTEDKSKTTTRIAFDTPLIIRHILSQLPIRDLLSCALVCQAWNYESRCILRDSRILVAAIEGEDPCLKLKEFDKHLETMSVVPYNGLTVRVPEDTVYPNCRGRIRGFKNVDHCYASILTKMKTTYLKIDWRSPKDPHPACGGIALLRKLFEMGQNLEHVNIKRLPSCVDLYSYDVTEDLDLRNLRTIKLFEDKKRYGSARDEIELRLVEEAPKLEQLYMHVVYSDQGFLPRDKLKCVTNLTFSPKSHCDLDFYEQIALASAKLQKLRVFFQPEMNLDRTWRVLKLILDSSKDSLCYLETNLPEALKLVKLKVPLNRVRKLFVALHYDWDELSLIPLVGSIDFRRFFPALESLILPRSNVNDSDRLQLYLTNEELAQGEQLGQEYTGGLVLTSRCVEEILPTLAAVFPNITSFYDSSKGDETPYRLLWELWPKLEQLVFAECGNFYRRESGGLTPFLNLDAEFCGISPEEAAELQTNEEEFLEKVLIVPTRPSITGLRDLRRFMLRIYVSSAEKFPPNATDLLLLSKVTGCLAFKRMRSRVDKMRMEVYNLTVDEPIARFSHMEPYIEVVFKK